ncbi:MAG TPA: formate dehydrogenase accessory protein FdhE [Desulfovibrio sp.]|uniref:formate dehydrogenase accessory protein FdhE n=1 Tax=Desulfovibrio TaxID=872 RepID=UPI00041B49E0|nr:MULTISPECIES: formate dehydrogenase accessory protein FdhE [Desulfovibrio]HMM39240.1 formate dehydrogenase accessory protein FdhE [Desulfovibrio sp.]
MHGGEQTTEEGRRILNDARRFASQAPALETLFSAFGPVLAAQAEIREQAPGWRGATPEPDLARFGQGVWLLADSGFQNPGPALGGAAATLLPVMERAFPALAGELAILRRSLADGSMPPDALFALAFEAKVQPPAGVSEDVLGFAAAQIAKPFVERQARDLAERIKGLPWLRGSCPICGGAPNYSQLVRVRDESDFIQAHGGQRWMRCATCSTQWRCKRVFCPACGVEEPDQLFHLHVAERPFERVDVCRSCKTYCLCLDTGELVDVPEPDMAALAMLPLEVLAREQGYAPLAGHAWNAVL